MAQSDARLHVSGNRANPHSRHLKLYTDLPPNDFEGLDGLVDGIEEAGYSGVLTTENRSDPFLPLAAIAQRHRTLELGTGVIALLARNPFVVAQSSWDLHYNTGERFILGVGTQSDEHLRWRYGVQYESKHQRLAESILAIRELWASWMENREPSFIGEYYKIESCPEAFRPMTKLSCVPKVYVLCSTMNDLEVSSKVADGIFTHPMWSAEYIDSTVWPYVLAQRLDPQFDIIAGAIIATGESKSERELARNHALLRLDEYLCSTKYDYVFDASKIGSLVFDFRRSKSLGHSPWSSDAGARLYTMFSCDASLDDLPRVLARHVGRNVSGVFPNVMSRIRRILPKEYVVRIANGD